MNEGENDMPNEIFIPGKHGGGERRQVTPIAQMSFGELNQKRLAGDFDGDEAIKRLSEARLKSLVETAGEGGVFRSIDKASKEILASSKNLNEAAEQLNRSKRDIVDQIGNVIPDLKGLPEAELENTELVWRLAEEKRRPKQGLMSRLELYMTDDEHKEKEAKYERTKLREIVYQPGDVLGKNLTDYEKDRPVFKYSEIKGVLENEDTDSNEFKDAYQKRGDLIRYYQRHAAINVKDTRDRIDEILATSDSSNVRERLRALQREVEEDAKEHPTYKDPRLAGDMVGGVVEVGNLAASLADPNRASQIREARSRALVLDIPVNQIEPAFRRTPTTPTAAPSGATPDFTAMIDAQTRAATAQEKMYELSLRSYKDFVDQEAQRAPMHPLNLLAERPGWFRQIYVPDQNQTETVSEIDAKNERMQKVVAFRSRLSYSSRTKQELGPLKLEASTHPEFMEWPTEPWDDMWMEMPGHRIAFITMFRENFKLDNRDIQFIELSEDGKRHLADFASYQREMIDKLADFIRNHPGEMEKGYWHRTMRNENDDEKAKLLATAAVKSVVNMLFVGGAAESGMQDRKINDKTVVSEQFRAFMHPLRKAVDKSAFDTPFTAEEWGGPMGNWYVQGVTYADGFRDLYDPDNLESSRGPKYFPPRLYCSIFEMAQFDESKARALNGKSFARAILELQGRQVRRLGDGLVDVSSTRDLRPRNLKYDELWGAQYGDVMDSVTKVFAVMSGMLEKDFTPNKLANALAKARKNKQLEEIFTNEGLLSACVAGMCGGPMAGSYRKGGREFLVNIPLEIYDIKVDEATREPRLFINNRGVDIRKNILKRLKAEDMSKVSIGAALRMLVSDYGLPGATERSDMYYEAVQNQAKMRRQEHFALKLK
ncbi:hypothetical protein A2803_00925 [Candidatus Woesebacteria bacterium RIFCSPHIGHO2_01_FULL_44_21]|uniref:Uncharacterized protein n=1 Tax=Candidatus Woesebacteria bacterium RIFCSPHIGHO2_01_FULL_44_21 TaxID=1802503 RepID=A0A1F7YX19_9BACT|nr:MAG: hypothetical protein A2803_00925 [Candidatus Woesebacteria bacterium RIFCSPHIGHO2_01_FULL_44_21]OGM69697.1 MAG: hypothetical protein A2897_00115 [Candidatus Woesebacteria bacterium RIFCSPLOWO2_01_FULL_44_24b]